MGEFKHMAERLLNILQRSRDQGESEGVTGDELIEILGGIAGHGGRINCYPGTPGADCCDLALFVSLSAIYRKPNSRGHLSCVAAIHKLVQHMQGICPVETKHAILITDSWDAAAYAQWRANFLHIGKQANVEIYLLSPGGVTDIPV